MPSIDPTAITPRLDGWRLWRRFLWLLVFGFLFVNASTFLAAYSLTHYVPGAALAKIHLPMTAWKKTRLFLGTLSLPRPMDRKFPSGQKLPSTTLRFPGSHGLKLEAWRIPGSEGRPIVLLFPGHDASKSSLLADAVEFHNLGYETWLVDFHGVGGSEGTTTSIGWDEADDVIAASREASRLRPGAPQILFGASLGAAAILRAEHLGTIAPAALILECPYDRLVTTLGNRFTRFGIPAFPIAHLLTFWGGVHLGFDAFAMNPVEFARDVRCPTLLLEGEIDDAVGPANARAIAAALGDHATFKLFPGIGHASYLQRAPENWRSAVHEFLGAHLAVGMR